MLQAKFHDRLNERILSGGPFVIVTLIDCHGSTPSDAGSKMVVSATGREFGTIGGGRIEARTIQAAQELLESGERTLFVDWSLKADIGMTCGGRVRLFFEAWNSSPWQVVIFGAGHVTQALARLLLTLPCKVTCVDPRSDWLDQLPDGVATLRLDDPKSHVQSLSDETHVLCMTRGHKSDFPILQEIFVTGRQLAYLGVIGSNAKAAVLRKELKEVGIESADFHCPIGLPIGSNLPSEIAISIAAQLLTVRDS